MIFVSDIHDSPDALQRLVAIGEEVVILGDLVNLTDYRTGRGAIADVLGFDFAAQTSAARAKGNYGEMRDLWSEQAASSSEDLRSLIGDRLGDQYRSAGEALADGRGLVIHGNVDRPGRLREVLPHTFDYVHGQVVERDGLRFGFVGGGVTTALQADGEISDEEMKEILESLGRVDVLCTHVPPAVGPLRRDVVTGREERGSDPIHRYLIETQPLFHFFGDVHQPQATTWRLGQTRCMNAGYFRATGRYLRLDGRNVHVGTVGKHS